MMAFGEIGPWYSVEPRIISPAFQPGPWEVVAALIVVAAVVGPLLCIWFFFIRKPRK